MQLFKKRRDLVLEAQPLSERELVAGFATGTDNPLLRSIMATIQGERELARRRISQGNLRDAELHREAGRMAALDDLERDIASGLEKARRDADRRATLRGRLA